MTLRFGVFFLILPHETQESELMLGNHHTKSNMKQDNHKPINTKDVDSLSTTVPSIWVMSDCLGVDVTST